MPEVIKVCSPAPPPRTPGNHSPFISLAVISTQLWAVGSKISYAYLDNQNSHKAQAVDATIPTWTQYANITFKKSPSVSQAQIRISFAGSGSWSTIGGEALSVVDPTQATMNLGWLDDQYPPSPEDRGTILHEFGHALGMLHALQSPARDEILHLNELAVYNYFRPLLSNDNSLVKTQVIDEYNVADLSNYSHFDTHSIMMYAMPASLNREGVNVRPNLELSQLDKAFITLTYPRQDADAVSVGGMKVLDALNIAGVPQNISAGILTLLNNNDLEGVRTAFSTYNKSVMSLTAVNQNLANIVSTTGQQYAVQIRDSVATIMNDPMFKAILKNMVNGFFQKRSIPTVNYVPGAAQMDVLDTLGAVSTNPTFAESVRDLNTFFTGVPPSVVEVSS